LIGSRLGRYEIVDTLGEGGMGVVYKARDAQRDRFVAIKVLPGASATQVGRVRAARAIRQRPDAGGGLPLRCPAG
jgi:serine/threonine protein kinase